MKRDDSLVDPSPKGIWSNALTTMRTIRLQHRFTGGARRRIGEATAEANDAGWGTEETVEALKEVIKNTKVALDLDPGPADDPG